MNGWMREYLGKRVGIIGDHPHRGKSGVAESIDRTIVGDGLRVVFGPHEDGCFVFDPKHICLERRG